MLATVRHNALFVPAVAALAWLWATMALRAFAPGMAERRWARGPGVLLRRPAWLLGIVAAFFVLRNVPGLPVHLLSG